MKVMLREGPKGLEVYVPKKDLEELVVAQERDTLWGGWVDLANGWRLSLPEMPAETPMPVTVDARRLSGD